MNKKIILISLIFGIFIAGCATNQVAQEPLPTEAEVLALSLCESACRDALSKGRNLSAGPCLLDPIPKYKDWVCDVAHEPREAIDNLRENQCNAWHNGTANHFIEVTPECKFIKEVKIKKRKEKVLLFFLMFLSAGC